MTANLVQRCAILLPCNMNGAAVGCGSGGVSVGGGRKEIMMKSSLWSDLIRSNPFLYMHACKPNTADINLDTWGCLQFTERATLHRKHLCKISRRPNSAMSFRVCKIIDVLAYCFNIAAHVSCLCVA